MPKYDKRIAILEKIIYYCEQIDNTMERFGKTYDTFSDDFAYQSTCAMCLMQIGEMAARFPEDFRTEHDRIPWHLIRAMRNVCAHDYQNVSLVRMWKTLETDIPILKTQCKEILCLLQSELPS